jgi:opacity protein-like surface antigen
MTPVTLSIQGRYPLNARFVPYISLGGGFYINKFTLDSGISKSWDDLGFDVSEKVKNCLGFHVGGGLDYYLTGDITVRVDVRYLLASTQGEWNQTDQISGVETSGEIKNLNLNSLVLGVGIKFQFRLF